MTLAPSASPPPPLTLRFRAGTIELRGELRPREGAGLGEPLAADQILPAAVAYDPREGCYRAPAMAYADIVMALRAAKIPYDDQARAYPDLSGQLLMQRDPRPYQTEAVAAWSKNRGRGLVVLPTGAGKTHVAVMAIAEKRRAALVVAPTLDLVRQWYDNLRTTFPERVGIVGGGEHDPQPLTVTTYDSAYLHMEHLGARFGLVIFDEAHHLPSAAYALAAQLCLAPFRLGLTATPERADGREEILTQLIGPTVYRLDIHELSGDYLADYETVRLIVDLSEAERAEYESERAIYRAFVDIQGIRMSQPSGFSEFIMRSARSAEGRRAMAAYRRQRELAFGAPGKLDVVARLLSRHRDGRTLVFTENNATAYAVSRRFLIPAITHQTKVRERSEILERFAKGSYDAVVTSKVLNEGVDVPDANVAIVMSGSGSVREHVQRLGRILRKQADKRAILYEIVSGQTGETFTSERRRDHVAYR